MNIPEKIYCRSFQAVLHTALPVLPYRKPKLLDSINEVPYLFRKKDIDCVLLITDPSIRRLGITRPLEDTLDKSGITCIVYDKTVANPTSNNV